MWAAELFLFLSNSFTDGISFYNLSYELDEDEDEDEELLLWIFFFGLTLFLSRLLLMIY